MDQIALVASDALAAEAKKLTAELDKSAFGPAAVMWVVSPETGNGRLWIVPRTAVDKRAFYVAVGTAISQLHLQHINVGMVEMIDPNRAHRTGLTVLPQVQGISEVIASENYLNGVSLPQGIIIRMDIPHQASA